MKSELPFNYPKFVFGLFWMGFFFSIQLVLYPAVSLNNWIVREVWGIKS